jgi:hypothetical protein
MNVSTGLIPSSSPSEIRDLSELPSRGKIVDQTIARLIRPRTCVGSAHTGEHPDCEPQMTPVVVSETVLGSV